MSSNLLPSYIFKQGVCLDWILFAKKLLNYIFNIILNHLFIFRTSHKKRNKCFTNSFFSQTNGGFGFLSSANGQDFTVFNDHEKKKKLLLLFSDAVSSNNAVVGT